MKKRNFLIVLTSLVILVLALAGAACAGGGKVKLSFETNGGSAVDAFSVKPGSEVTLPVPQKQGELFDGWYTASDFKGDRYEGKVTAPEEDTKYYAKWAASHTVTLDLDGGTLSTTTVFLKEGDNVYEAVRSLVPTKSGLTFGAWFYNGAEITEAFRMPAGDLTLTAKYKVDYLIEVYLQNLSKTSYQRDDTKEVAGRWYVDEEYSPDVPVIDNYTYQATPEGKQPVERLTLSADTSKNVYSMYFDRMNYGILYEANVPLGETATGETAYTQDTYGASVNIAACGFSIEGWRFAGWAESQTGEVVYAAGQQIYLMKPMTLYAVWDQGYTDRYGSPDLIFFPRTDSHLAILRRDGVEFEGTRDGTEFSFTTDSGITFGGAVLGGVFCYEKQDLKGTYYLYDNYPRPAEEGEEETYDRYDRTCTLVVDEYLNAVYTVNGKSTEGALEFFAEQGDYVFTGNDGKTSFHTVFQKADEAENNIFSISGEEFGYYVDSNGEVLVFDGYGTAFLQVTLTSGQTVTISGNYYIEGEGRAFDRYDTYKIVCWLNDTSGLLGGTAGWNQYFICAVPDYWKDAGLSSEYGVYYFADTSRGTYEDGEGGKLVLDGHGYYDDSAVYTSADGKTVKGRYSVQSDFVSGSVIEVGKDATHVEMRFRLSADGTFSVYNGPQVEYTEYYLLEGSSMKPVLLAIFEEAAAGHPGSLRAEFYTNNAKNVAVHAASGYVTSEAAVAGSDILIYTFTRTSVEYGFDATIATEMKFTTTTVQTGSQTRYSVYCVLERNGETLYEVIRLDNGGTVWANSSVEVDGEGSLYFLDGRVYRCSFPTYQDTYFNEYYGELLYYGTDAQGNVETNTQLYTLTACADAGVDYTAEPASSLPIELYYFDPMLSPTNGVFLELVLAPDGSAAYDDTGTAEHFDKGMGTFEATGEFTLFGSPIYKLTIGGEERMRFTMGNIYFLGITYTGFFPYTGHEGEYTAENGTTLRIDGYGTARFTADGGTSEGSYYFISGNVTAAADLTGEVARVTVADGTESEFEFEGGEDVSPLDPIYGTWDLVDGNFHPLNNYSKIFFDGKGTFTITPEGGTSLSKTQGRYILADAEYGEYTLLNATIGGVKGNYNVRFMEYVEYNNYNCVVRDKASGVYVDEDYNVLTLNGFGSGSITGNGYNSMGNFYNIDESVGFGYFLFTTVNTAYYDEIIHLLLDMEHGTFEILQYSDYLYIASDLDHIAFRNDGAVFIGNMLNGDYYVTKDGTVKAYFYNQYSYSYERRDMPAIGGSGEYTYEGKTYYPFTEKMFTASGVIHMLDENGDPQSERAAVNATLSFEARLRGIVGFPVTFNIEKQDYTGYLLSTYKSGKIDPRIEYNNLTYDIDFTRTDGKWTFDIKDAGVRVLEREDINVKYYDGAAQSGTVYHQGGKMDITYNGFGPYLLEETYYAGRFLYFYDESLADKGVLSFSNLKEKDIRTVGYHNLGTGFGGYHELREIVFKQGEKTYAIDFFEYASGSVITTYTYLLYGFYEYEEVQANGYTLGVKYLLKTTLSGSPGYGDDSALEKPVAVTVLKGQEKTPVVALSSGARYDNKGVWFVENNGGRAGDAYLVTFTFEGEKVTGGTVEVGSVQTVGLTASYLFYIFVDSEGDIAEIMVAWYAGDQFESVTDIQRDEENENVWSFRGKETAGDPDRIYTLTFRKGTSGVYTVTVESVIAED